MPFTFQLQSSCNRCYQGVPSVYLGFAIWSIFLSHRDSLPFYKWMASLGCSIRGINDNRVSVVGASSSLCLAITR